MRLNKQFRLAALLLIAFASDLSAQRLLDSLVHPHTVYGADISADGTMIFTAGKDSIARIWDAKGMMIRELKGHDHAVSSIDYYDATQTILTGAYDNQAILWNMEGEILARFKGHENGVIKVFQHGEFVATASRDNTAGVWHRNGELLFWLKGHRAQVNRILFSARKQWFVTCSYDGFIKIWNRNGALVDSFSPSDSGIRALALSDKHEMMIAGHKNGVLSFLDFEGNLLRTIQAHQSMIDYIELFDEDRFLGIGSPERSVQIWSIKGEKLAEWTGHQSYVSSVSVAGDVMVTSSGDQTVKTWDIAELRSTPKVPFSCANDGYLFLKQLLGAWDVHTRDRTSPGVYEENSGKAVVSTSIDGCGISMYFEGYYRGKPFAQQLELAALDTTRVQMVRIDSEHGGFMLSEGAFKNQDMELFWFRDKEVKRLRTKYLLNLTNANEFEFSSYLSTDHGDSWALTHQRIYRRSDTGDYDQND